MLSLGRPLKLDSLIWIVFFPLGPRNYNYHESTDHQMLLWFIKRLRQRIVDGFPKEFHKRYSNLDPKVFILESIKVLC